MQAQEKAQTGYNPREIIVAKLMLASEPMEIFPDVSQTVQTYRERLLKTFKKNTSGSLLLALANIEQRVSSCGQTSGPYLS